MKNEITLEDKIDVIYNWVLAQQNAVTSTLYVVEKRT